MWTVGPLLLAGVATNNTDVDTDRGTRAEHTDALNFESNIGGTIIVRVAWPHAGMVSLTLKVADTGNIGHLRCRQRARR